MWSWAADGERHFTGRLYRQSRSKGKRRQGRCRGLDFEQVEFGPQSVKVKDENL